MISKRLLTLAAVPAIALASAGAALAGSSAPATPTSAANVITPIYTACVKGTTIVAFYKGSHGCALGQVRDTWNQTGPQGPQGIQGAQGIQGPPGPKGDTGTFVPVSASASFTLSGRDDSGAGGNWAKDNITRLVTVTRHGAAPASDCGASATQCWFYTDVITDTGTFTTDAGALTPNQLCTEPTVGTCAGLHINGTVVGTLSGGGDQEFFADSPSPTVPSTLSYIGNNPIGTSEWYKLFFGGGTHFGLAAATSFGTPWTTWGWNYLAPATCETWKDTMPDAGNGTFLADGNIAGVNQCV